MKNKYLVWLPNVEEPTTIISNYINNQSSGVTLFCNYEDTNPVAVAPASAMIIKIEDGWCLK